MQLDVTNGRALNNLGTLADDTFDQHDALVLQTRGPLQHLLADLLWGKHEQSLHGVGALAEDKEDHLAPLRAGCLHTSADQHRLAVHVGVEGGDLSTRSMWARLRLVERLLAIVVGGKVLGVVRTSQY